MKTVMHLLGLLVIGAGAFVPIGNIAAQTTFTVNSTNNVDDGTCDATHCSLREAINAANANAGADMIEFNISGPGPHTIQPNSALPTITDPVVIDGTTEPDFAGTPIIELDGTNAGGVHGLEIIAGSSTVRGLVINRFGLNGVLIDGAGATGNLIEGNFIGTDVTGTSALGNGLHGVSIVGAPNNTVGGTTAGAGNVISGNSGFGIEIIFAGATGNLVQGNFIGTDVTGTAAIGNTLGGVVVSDAPDNTVGGTTAEARNVISGNSGHGVWIDQSGAMANLVQGNFIGTDVNGTVALANALEGVQIENAPNNTIGGTTAGARNVISGNISNGVSMNDIGATGNLVQGNYIGTDVTGTAAIGNGNAGVLVGNVGNAANNTIGGTTAGARNVISGNLEGVTIADDGPGAGGNLVQGNYIGTDVTGTSAVGNGLGVLLIASGNTIGGTSAGAGNTIAFNTGPGLNINSGTGNAILSNSFFSNADIAIDLGADGVTANDAGDGDAGANNLQNFPVLTSAFQGSTTIEGTLNSTPSTTFTLEFFSNSACDPSDHGEGESLLGSTMVTTDGGGDASFMVTVPTDLPTGTFITATATDPGNNTSEFSRCAAVADFTVAVSPASVTVVRGEAATYTVTVSPQGGAFGGDVSLACSDLPAQASCSFSPSTVTPGAIAVTSTLTVSTTVPGTPTGTFTITGTSGSLERSTTATLVVTTDFAIAVSPASVTVTQGQAAAYTVSVSPVGGSFDEAVSLTCSDLPTLTSCSFSPSEVTPGASAVTSTLTVSTTAPSASLTPPRGEQDGAPMYALWLGLLALGLPGLVLVGVAFSGRESKRGKLGLYWALAPALLAALTLSAGCGDDGITSPGTATGTFTFTITGTSGSLQHSTTATVVVQ